MQDVELRGKRREDLCMQENMENIGVKGDMGKGEMEADDPPRQPLKEVPRCI